MDYKTEQEAFWAGEFGNQYKERNVGDSTLASKTAMFAQIFEHLDVPIESVIELGANIGLNLVAMKRLIPGLKACGIDVNESAVAEMAKIPDVEARCDSILSFEPAMNFDFSLICGVLIHINPDCLQDVYERLYKSSRKYICIAEYYNPTPVMVPYRGESERLFKRDFAGEFMQAYPDVRLVHQGFRYRNHPVFPADDITWFLMKKEG